MALLPRGPVVDSRRRAAESVRARRPAGERLVVRGRAATSALHPTLTLWHGGPGGLPNHDRRVHRLDRLVRLRWPCPVPGALPVSEVGDAVIGRGFGLMHERGADSAVDAAQHPWTWTTRPTAGSGCPRRRASASATGCARSVAEVVAADERRRPLARDLMVALVRAGVTATCSALTAALRLLDVELQSAGRPSRSAGTNAFTAAVLAERTRSTPTSSSGSCTPPARPGWVPAAAPLAGNGCPARTCAACARCRCW